MRIASDELYCRRSISAGTQSRLALIFSRITRSLLLAVERAVGDDDAVDIGVDIVTGRECHPAEVNGQVELPFTSSYALIGSISGLFPGFQRYPKPFSADF